MKASVCIITYNHEQWIADAINSALMQEADFDFEIVISDDASTDGTLEIVQKYQQNHPDKIRIITSSKNLGCVKNVKRAIDNSQGEFIALMAGDDFWNDEAKLQDQVDFLESNDGFSASVTQANVEYHGHLDKRFCSNYARTQEVWNGKDVVATPSFAAASSIVFRTNDLLPLPRWFEDVAYGDSAIQGILAKRGRFHYLQRKATTYRCNNWGLLHQLRKKGKAYMSDTAETIKHHISQPA